MYQGGGGQGSGFALLSKKLSRIAERVEYSIRIPFRHWIRFVHLCNLIRYHIILGVVLRYFHEWQGTPHSSDLAYKILDVL